MKILRRLAVIFWGLAQACAVDGATRLAVWATPAVRDEAALLAAELSEGAASAGYELLEREELVRLVAERSLAAPSASELLRAGRLLGATGVAWLEEAKIGGEPRLILRLGAVESGLVAGWRIYESEPSDHAEWAKRAARQLKEWLPRLEVPREAARAVSLLNLRRAGGEPGFGRGVHEQTLTLVLGAALANQPRLRVLERWRLDDLALEVVLGGMAQHEFWRGATLLDGSFTEAGGEIALSLRLRFAGRAEARWTLTGRDAGELIARAAAEVARRLSDDPFAVSWDRAAEAREFLEEARWATRWNLHAKAVAAAEAAIVLGGATPELRRIRYLARGRLVWGGREPVLSLGGDGAPRWIPSGIHIAAPPLERIVAATEVLALFAEHRARTDSRDEDGRPAGPPRMLPPVAGVTHLRHTTRAELDAAELLGGAARVLADVYRATELDAGRRDAAAELRRAARETFVREREALGLRSRPRASETGLPEPVRGGLVADVADTLPLVAYAHGAFWAERLADHQELAGGLLATEFDGEPAFLDSMLRVTTSRRSDAWEVDWATRDSAAARTQWAAKAREWVKSPDVGLRLAGAFQLLALNSPFGMPAPGEGPGAGQGTGKGTGAGPPPEWARFGTREEQEARVTEGLQALAAAPGAKGRIPRAYLEALNVELSGRVPEGAKGAWARLSAPGPGAGVKKTTPEALVAQVRQEKIPMGLHWLAPEARVPATALDDYNRRRGIRWAERVAGRVRVITEEAAERGGGPPRFTLSEIELVGFRERRLGRWSLAGPRDFNDHMGFPAFAMIGERVFCWEGGELWRRGLDGDAGKRLDLPVTGQARLWALGGRLYVASNEGGILRVHPETGAWEMLADSRRRPAEGPLDDRRPYAVNRMWSDADGAVRACVTTRGEQVFRRDEARRTWVLESEKPHANLPGHRYQRAECVAWLENIGLAAPGFGRDELDRLEADVERAGDWRRPEGFDPGAWFAGAGPTPLESGRGRLVWMSRLGGMTRRGDVWMLYHFWHDKRRAPRLVWMPARETGREIVCAELEILEALLTHLSVNPNDLLYGGIGGEYARFLEGSEGVAIYAVGAPVLWFISKNRLEAAGLAWDE